VPGHVDERVEMSVVAGKRRIADLVLPSRPARRPRPRPAPDALGIRPDAVLAEDLLELDVGAVESQAQAGGPVPPTSLLEAGGAADARKACDRSRARP
jgi:hypothetical protein